MTTKTTDYEITDYGIENAQYFQGHGTSYTDYEHGSLGCGDTYRAALEDALEQAASSGFDIELSPEDDPSQPANDKEESAWKKHEEYCDEGEHDNCESELYYYVGLRWN